MKIKPISNRVLIEIDESPSTFASGLLIAKVPDREGDYSLEPQRGRVLEIGPDVKDVDVGDRVVCTKYNGVRLSPRDWDGRKLLLIRETHIIVKMNVDYDALMFGVSHADNRPGRLGDRG